MAYRHQLRHRHPHEMHNQVQSLVVRDPQRSDDDDQSNSKNGNSKASASSKSNTVVEEDALSSLVSVVWVTASPTFTGEVAGYTTLSPSAAEPTRESAPFILTQPQKIEPTSTSEFVWIPATTYVAPAETTAQAPPSPSTSWEVATTYSPPATNAASAAVADASSLTFSSSASTLPTSIAVAVSSASTLMSSYVTYSRTATRSLSTVAPSSTAAAAAAASSSGGMSSGGKAGLTIGIFLIIALVAGAALWFYWKKKKQNNEYQKTDDEKIGGFGGPVAAMATKSQGTKSVTASVSEKCSTSAPRLSLGPVTQFGPDLAAAKTNAPGGMAAAGAGRNLTRDNPNSSPWERRAEGGSNASNPFKDPVNPFGDQVKARPPPNVTITPPTSDAGPGMTAAAGGAAAGAALAMGAAAKDGQRKTGPGSPEGSKVAPGVAGGPPAGNVHRVQLDFKPSMEDELELHAGQLIRVLHEYDDGWALCIRLDRSQQGVAPRTCLSTRPVKPRPGNGSPRMAPNGRAMSPAPGRPMSPGQARPMTPTQGRPRSPATGPGPRPNSPAGSSHGPSRPGTANGNRSMSPLGPNQPSMQPSSPNQMAPGQFNQAPRPLSPGPVARNANPQQPKRSQSPGPYGANPGPQPMTTDQRRRSNSTSAMQATRSSPPSSGVQLGEDPMPGWRPPKPQNNAEAAPGVAL